MIVLYRVDNVLRTFTGYVLYNGRCTMGELIIAGDLFGAGLVKCRHCTEKHAPEALRRHAERQHPTVRGYLRAIDADAERIESRLIAV